MPSGFDLVVENGTVTVRRLGGAQAGRLVTTAEDGSLSAVLFGRLYHRDEAAAAIGAGAGTIDNDAALALASYRASGIVGIERLEGDFAVAIVDGDRQRIVASRDPAGGFPVYWIRKGGTLGVATCLRPLDDLLGGAEPDIGLLGEIQMMSYVEIDYLDASALAGVHRLVPGTLLVAGTAGGEVEVRRFWSWADRIADPGTDDLDAIAGRYAELLDRAVAERLRGTVASHFSGGMDSTSAALLAHRHLAARGQPLHALAIVYERLFGMAEEARYIDAAADRPGLVLHRLPGDGLLDFSHFASSPLYDEPYTGFFRTPIGLTLIEAAERAGADTVLTGLGADELAADMPYYIADELRRGRVLTAWREAARWARARTRNPWRTFQPFGVEPLVPAWLRPGLRAALSGGYAPLGRQNGWTIPPWVLRDFARRGRLRERALAGLRRSFRSADSVVLSNALATLAQTGGDWMRAQLAAPRGLLITHPFRDRRLMAHALGARLRVRPSPGEQKVLLGRAMRDVLPEAILRRRGKGTFNAVYFQGLARNLPVLERLVEASDAEAMGLFDKTLLTGCLRQAALGVDQVRGVFGLNNSLAILHWLAQLPAWRAAPLAADVVYAATTGGGSAAPSQAPA